MKAVKGILLAIAAVIIAAGAGMIQAEIIYAAPEIYYDFADTQVPEGQPSLLTVDSATLEKIAENPAHAALFAQALATRYNMNGATIDQAAEAAYLTEVALGNREGGVHVAKYQGDGAEGGRTSEKAVQKTAVKTAAVKKTAAEAENEEKKEALKAAGQDQEKEESTVAKAEKKEEAKDVSEAEAKAEQEAERRAAQKIRTESPAEVQAALAAAAAANAAAGVVQPNITVAAPATAIVTVPEVEQLPEVPLTGAADMNINGGTYVDVNKALQKLTLYIAGNPTVVTDIVTGRSGGRETPSGLFSVYGKAQNRTLKGANYSAFVKFWMPFYRNYGLHDANWRSQFGGTIYQTNGSHGCVNIPPEIMPTLYASVNVGTPVWVH